MFGRKAGGTAATPTAGKPAAVPAAASPRANAGMSEGKQAYEARRAKEAGLSLDAWLARKRSAAATAATTAAAAQRRPVPQRKGLLSRLLDKAHQPLK